MSDFDSELELQLYAQIEQAGLPVPRTQYPLCGHKADFAWPDAKVCAEVQGGTWKRGGGRHNRGIGYAEDRMLSNHRQLEGWLCLEFTVDHLNADQAVPAIRLALAQRGQIDPSSHPVACPRCGSRLMQITENLIVYAGCPRCGWRSD